MSRLFFMVCLFISCSSYAQSYLGKSKKDIYKLSQVDFENPIISDNTSTKDPFIEIINEYETLHYYLKNDACVKFVVYKPYSCNCIETDIKNYNKHLIPIGDLKWISLDQSKIYQINLDKEGYSTSIILNEENQLGSISRN